MNPIRGGRALSPEILAKADSELTTQEWQAKLAHAHLVSNYPQQFGKVPDIGTVSRLGLLESTGPLLGDSPVNLGKFRVITALVTVFAVGTCFMLMPETINGRRHIFSSVRVPQNPHVSLGLQSNRLAGVCSDAKSTGQMRNLTDRLLGIDLPPPVPHDTRTQPRDA